MPVDWDREPEWDPTHRPSRRTRRPATSQPTDHPHHRNPQRRQYRACLAPDSRPPTCSSWSRFWYATDDAGGAVVALGQVICWSWEDSAASAAGVRQRRPQCGRRVLHNLVGLGRGSAPDRPGQVEVLVGPLTAWSGVGGQRHRPGRKARPRLVGLVAAAAVARAGRAGSGVGVGRGRAVIRHALSIAAAGCFPVSGR